MFVRRFFLIAISLSTSIGVGNSATPAEPSTLAQQQTSTSPAVSPNVGHKENPKAKKLSGVLHKESGSTGGKYAFFAGCHRPCKFKPRNSQRFLSLG